MVGSVDGALVREGVVCKSSATESPPSAEQPPRPLLTICSMAIRIISGLMPSMVTGFWGEVFKAVRAFRKQGSKQLFPGDSLCFVQPCAVAHGPYSA